jgi:TonB family protein
VNGKLTFILCLVALSPQSLPAKPIPRRAIVAKAQQLPPTPFTFDMLKGEKIDPKYQGDSLPALITQFEKVSAVKKGEFESTQQFNDRVTKLLSSASFLGRKFNDYFAVRFSIEKYNSLLNYEFNADSEMIAIKINIKNDKLNGIGAAAYSYDSAPDSSGKDILDIQTNLTNAGIYVGQNSYGTKVRGDISRLYTFGAISNKMEFVCRKTDINYSDKIDFLNIKMDRSMAAKEIPVLKGLIVFQPEEPFLYYDFYSNEPTTLKPDKITQQAKYLSAKVAGIVIYSGLSGRILGKMPRSIGEAPISAQDNSNCPTVKPDLPPTSATPYGNDNNLRDEDYPSESSANEEEGITRVTYLVGIDGRTSQCKVISSSGFKRLDDATCSIVINRFRFNPATKNGEPIQEQKTQPFRWRITR